MNRFLKHWRLSGRGEAFRAHTVNYADDFVILSRGHAKEALAWTKVVMTKHGLTLNEAKTSLTDARRESESGSRCNLSLPWLMATGRTERPQAPNNVTKPLAIVSANATLVSADLRRIAVLDRSRDPALTKSN